jgi:hypothetical protein
MNIPSNDFQNRAAIYCSARGLTTKDTLGYGKDGIVFSTSNGTALKIFASSRAYEAERDCYLRLAEHAVVAVEGHHVPQIVASDDALQIIEMTIVTAPYLLDFASARLDWGPEFPADVMVQWEADRAEEFGDNWSRVKAIIYQMEQLYGIILLDIHPRNISFVET